jgi:hypothetical protein
MLRRADEKDRLDYVAFGQQKPKRAMMVPLVLAKRSRALAPKSAARFGKESTSEIKVSRRFGYVVKKFSERIWRFIVTDKVGKLCLCVNHYNRKIE